LASALISFCTVRQAAAKPRLLIPLFPLQPLARLLEARLRSVAPRLDYQYMVVGDRHQSVTHDVITFAVARDRLAVFVFLLFTRGFGQNLPATYRQNEAAVRLRFHTQILTPGVEAPGSQSSQENIRRHKLSPLS
jgi:hypothetical protein